VQDERSFLAPLPLAMVDPPPGLAAILDGWGIRTLGALTALPKPEVGRRLGQAGIDLWERAAGETDRPIEPCAPDATFAAAMDLEHEVETLEPLLFILRRFVDRLALQLAHANLVAAELALELTLADETTYRRGFRLPEPAGDPDILFRALQTHLETLHTDSAIKGVRLTITPTRPLVRQHGLFDTGLRDPHGFAETLARVEAVVGRDRVGTPGLEPTHRPDAFLLEKPVDVVGPLPPPPILPPLGLPLRRFRPPVEAQVATGPGGPASVQSRIARGEVRRRRGPWRRSGEWWKPGRWAGEEWDIELARGGLFRLACRAGQWWVEGMYD
jgi:protein ImuB